MSSHEVKELIEKIVRRKKGIFEVNEMFLKEICDRITSKEIIESFIPFLDSKFHKSIFVYNIKLFHCVNYFFINLEEFRIPFLDYLQKSLLFFIQTTKEKQNKKNEISNKKLFINGIIRYLVEWKHKFGYKYPQIQLSLNFLKTRCKNQVDEIEGHFESCKNNDLRSMKNETEDQQRKFSHLMNQFHDNRVCIKSSLNIVQNSLDMLIPDFEKIYNVDVPIEEKNTVIDFSKFDSKNVPVEFAGPSIRNDRLFIENKVEVKGCCNIKIYQSRDNEDIIANLKDNMKLLVKRFSPLLNKVLKELNKNGTSEHIKEFDEISKLSYQILKVMRQFDFIQIIKDDMSFNLMGSDDEADDDDFEDVY